MTAKALDNFLSPQINQKGYYFWNRFPLNCCKSTTIFGIYQRIQQEFAFFIQRTNPTIVMTDGLVFMIINASPNPVLSEIPAYYQHLSNSLITENGLPYDLLKLVSP